MMQNALLGWKGEERGLLQEENGKPSCQERGSIEKPFGGRERTESKKYII